ncbi:hypothetical protein, partial [Klebsiella pneumoniae]|uniref:hypothetical protein n=1 Tax=Klebsiella pneumoniae TaxID=573 RepID=UPI002730C82D
LIVGTVSWELGILSCSVWRLCNICLPGVQSSSAEGYIFAKLAGLFFFFCSLKRKKLAFFQINWESIPTKLNEWSLL